MPSKCSVPGCKSNYDSTFGYVSIFGFPRDAEMREKWIKYIPRKDFVPTKASGVCIKHFLPCDIIISDTYTDKSGVTHVLPRKCPALKRNAYPSLFPELTSYLSVDIHQPRKNPVPEERASEIVKKNEENIKDLDCLSSDVIHNNHHLQSQKLLLNTSSSSMACKKSVADLKAHLACYDPVYPFKKGCIAQLLVETRAPTIIALLRKVQALVPATSVEQNKCVDEIKLSKDLQALKRDLKLKKGNLTTNWDSLVLLCQQPFPVHFKEVSKAVVLLQPQEISLPTDVSIVSTATVRPPSPKKLRYDCHNCNTKQRTLNNLRETIVTLRRRLFDQRKHYAQLLANLTPKMVNETNRRKESIFSSRESMIRNCGNMKQFEGATQLKQEPDCETDSIKKEIQREEEDSYEPPVKKTQASYVPLTASLEEGLLCCEDCRQRCVAGCPHHGPLIYLDIAEMKLDPGWTDNFVSPVQVDVNMDRQIIPGYEKVEEPDLCNEDLDSALEMNNITEMVYKKDGTCVTVLMEDNYTESTRTGNLVSGGSSVCLESKTDSCKSQNAGMVELQSDEIILVNEKCYDLS